MRAIPECESLIEQVCRKVLDATAFLSSVRECEVSVVLADDSFIHPLNHQYRGKDASTNVLSFPGEALEAGHYDALSVDGQPVVLGDIVLSLDTLKKEALTQEKTLHDHCCHLLVHGMLHLLGYDHEDADEAAIMEYKEIEILCELGIKSPYEALEE